MTDKTEAWRAAFDERHQFDVYPDDFMTGMRNEFCAGWHAAMKNGQPKPLTRQALHTLLTRHAVSLAEWDDGSLEYVNFGQYGFEALFRELSEYVK